MRFKLSASVEDSNDAGRLQALAEFVRGPGHVGWPDISANDVFEYTIALSLRGGSKGGAQNIQEATQIAKMMRDKIRHLIETGQRNAELNPKACWFDLQSIRPIPREILLSGINGKGRVWMEEFWGVEAPLTHVERQVSETKIGWEFGADRFPWPCFRILLRDWKDIDFRVEFEDAFGKFDKVWRRLERQPQDAD